MREPFYTRNEMPFTVFREIMFGSVSITQGNCLFGFLRISFSHALGHLA